MPSDFCLKEILSLSQSFSNFQKGKWEISNSVFKASGDSATQFLQKFVLKEGSENSTDSLVELLFESGTSEEEYFSTFLLTLQWVLLQNKDKYFPEICLSPAASIIL